MSGEITMNHPRLKLGIVTCGLILAGSQVLIIRRALAFAGGDEVVYALALAAWLLTVSAGGAIGSRLVGLVRKETAVFAFGLMLLACFAPLSLILLHLISAASAWVPGTVPGGGGLIVALLLSLLPVGLIGGALFPLGCHLLSDSGRRAISTVYLLEAAGSFLAGTAVTLIFAPHLGGLILAVFFALLGIVVAVSILQTKIPLWLPALIALAAIFIFGGVVRSFEMQLFSLLRPGLQLRDLLETPYGIIEITERQGQVAVHENGLLLAISDDPAGVEERAHLPLVQHPAPRRVLWIGGSLGGAVQSALRHPSIERLDLVELNPILFELDTLFSRGEDERIAGDGRVFQYDQDGRLFASRIPPQSYDIISLNLPGPRTARLAKFYTMEALRVFQRALKSGGVLVFPIESSSDYIGKDLTTLLSSIYRTCRAVFDSVVVLPGENALFVAGDTQVSPALTAAEISERLSERGIELLYWDKYRLRDRLSESRYRTLQGAIHASSDIGLNHDGAPICFYLQQVFWSQQLRGGLPGVLKALRGVFVQICVLLIAVAFIAAISIGFISPKRKPAIGAGWAVAMVGLSGISLEILALIVYQVKFGSGYRELGLLMGLYMAGLALGAALTNRFEAARPRIFRLIQMVWVLVPLGLLALSSNWFDFVASLPLIGRTIFFLYLLIIGFVGGMHFPLAVSYSGRETARRAGIFYSLDLLGSTFGALIVGLLALPLVGVLISCMGLILINIPPLFLLLERRSLSG